MLNFMNQTLSQTVINQTPNITNIGKFFSFSNHQSINHLFDVQHKNNDKNYSDYQTTTHIYDTSVTYSFH